jgi:hypothetical protein
MQRILCRGLFWSLVAILGSACAAGRMALKPAVAESIETLRVVSFVSDDQPTVRVVQAETGGALFGLVGALVDAAVTSSRQSAAEDDLVALRAATQDLDHRSVLWTALEASLDSASWPERLEFKGVPTKAPSSGGDDFDALLSENPDAAHLFLDSHCYLSPGGVQLVMYTRASVYIGRPTRRRALDSSYAMDFWYVSEPQGFGTEGSSIGLWARDDASEYRRCLAEGTRATVEMLQRDLLSSARFPENLAGKEENFEFDAIDGVQKKNWKGRVVAEHDGLIFVRGKNGYLYAFPPSAPKEQRRLEDIRPRSRRGAS